MANTTLKNLEKLKLQLPSGTAGASARSAALKEAVREAPAGVTAEAIGKGLASQAGKDELARVSAAITERTQRGELELAEGQRRARERLARKQEFIQRVGEKNKQKLYDLNKSVANDILDKRNQFLLDKEGRRFLNERQLADYKLLTAKKQEDFQDFAQRLDTASKRKLQLMEATYKILDQARRQAFQASEQELDQVSKEKITKLAQEYERQVASEQSKAAKRSGIATGLMTVGAAVAQLPGYGTVIGGGMMAAGVILSQQQ